MLGRRGEVAFGSPKGTASVAALMFAVVALAGCPAGKLDPRRRHLVTVGLGAASLDEDLSLPDRLVLQRSLVVHGAYDYRVVAPGGWLAMSARVFSYANRGTHATPWLGGSVKGEGITRPCNLFWAVAGPAVGLQVPANLPMSLVVDAGAGLAYVSRKGCSDSGRTAAAAIYPDLGLGVLFGGPEAALKLGARGTRLPLDAIGVGSEPKWASVGELSVVVAF